MARQSELEMLFADLARLPWWVSVVLAIVVYVAVAEVLPRTMGDSTLLGPFVDIVSKFAALIAALFLIPAGASALRSIRSRRMLAANRSIDQRRDLSWQEFEELMEAYYEREGYDVVREGGNGPDGGVDLRLRRGGETVLVQCKQWRTRRVGPKVVRELLGVVSAEQADAGVVVTEGSFTAEAERFARDVPIELVDGDKLQTMINPDENPKTAGVSGTADTARDSPLGNDEVVRLTSAGVGAAVIVATIEASATDFDVGVDGIVGLTEAGVAEEVIEAMVKAARGRA